MQLFKKLSKKNSHFAIDLFNKYMHIIINDIHTS